MYVCILCCTLHNSRCRMETDGVGLDPVAYSWALNFYRKIGYDHSILSTIEEMTAKKVCFVLLQILSPIACSALDLHQDSLGLTFRRARFKQHITTPSYIFSSVSPPTAFFCFEMVAFLCSVGMPIGYAELTITFPASTLCSLGKDPAGRSLV